MASVHPYSKVEPLLCSTRCQVVVEHETEHALLRMKTFPTVMIMKILEYVSYSREEENALAKGDVSTRWTQLTTARNLDFFNRALRSDLFRFATHGIEATLPPNAGARFDALIPRIGNLYPKKFRGGLDYLKRFDNPPISPLDLPRVVTVTFPTTRFHPYKPLEWGKAAGEGDWNGNGYTYKKDPSEVWTNHSTYIHILGEDYPSPYMPSHEPVQSENPFLAPYRIGQMVFCPIIFQQEGSSTVSFGDMHVGGAAPKGVSQFSYLPIARAVVGSTAYCADDIADWALVERSDNNSETGCGYDFVLRRTRWTVVAPTELSGAKSTPSKASAPAQSPPTALTAAPPATAAATMTAATNAAAPPKKKPDKSECTIL